MADRPTVTVDPRELGRKSILRKLRQAGQVPGSVYGHGDPIAVAMEERALGAFIREHGYGSLVDVRVGGDNTPGLLKEIDRNPVTDQILHFAIQRVSLSEQINTTTAIEILGEDEREEDGGILSVQLTELSIRCRADGIPESIEINVAGLTIGDAIRVEDLTLPEGVESTNSPEQMIVTVAAPRAIEDEEAVEAAEGEGAAEGEKAAEGEEAAKGEG